jgi:predicted enzyme related to lactoylglutathione lyase
MAGEITFFELGVEDAERGRAFYGGLFDWRFERGPSGEGWAIATGGTPGGMHGGDPGAGAYVFFAVDDLDGTLARVRDLGGAVEEMDLDGDERSIARFGRFKLCRDDQGSPFGLHEPPTPSATDGR